MARRSRKHIPAREIAAAALSLLLPQETRDRMRSGRESAAAVLRLFTPDHIVLHCIGGADKWWNLDMRLRGPELKAKDARDTSIAAKIVRLDDKWRDFTRAMAAGRKPPKRKSRWSRAHGKSRKLPRGRPLRQG